MKKISKNLYLGERITNVADIHRLALERKSVAWEHNGTWYTIHPAAVIIGWPLRLVLNSTLYYTIK